MIFGILFAFWRFAEIITLVPIVGMLAWFVNGYVEANRLTPNYILILFIVSTLGLVWAIFTLFSYHRSKSNAQFVAFIDLGFVGALIAGVYYLRFIARADCANVVLGSDLDRTFDIFGSQIVNVEVSLDKTCGMLKASFAMAIMNIIFFFITSVLAWSHGSRTAKKEERYYAERRSTSRHRSRSQGGSRSGSRHRSGSRSRRSSHSHQRVYV